MNINEINHDTVLKNLTHNDQTQENQANIKDTNSMKPKLPPLKKK